MLLEPTASVCKKHNNIDKEPAWIFQIEIINGFAYNNKGIRLLFVSEGW
jgi:hypothetical protein